MRKPAPVSLVALLTMTFVFYTNDYVIAGILPEVAEGVRVSVAAAGQLVTVFSLTIAIVAPIAAITLTRMSRRRLFAAAFVILIGANAAAVFASTFEILIALRVLAAAAAAAATPALFAFTASIAPQGRSARYIAIVTLGVTGSIAAGVPLGTWIGGHFGWRMTFAAMALAGVVSLMLVYVALPRDEQPGASKSLVEQIRSLTSVPILLGLLASCALMAGAMMLLTYFVPFLEAVTESGLSERTLAFSLAGAAGMAGLVGGGLTADRLGPRRTLTIGICVFLAAMLGLWSLQLLESTPFYVVLILGIIWGGSSFWNAPAIHARLHGLAGPLATQALALNTSSNFLGVSVGGALGGIVVAQFGAGQLPLLSAGFAATALVLLLFAARWPAREERANDRRGQSSGTRLVPLAALQSPSGPVNQSRKHIRQKNDGA